MSFALFFRRFQRNAYEDIAAKTNNHTKIQSFFEIFNKSFTLMYSDLS